MTRNKLMILNALVAVFSLVINTVLGMIEVNLLLTRYGSAVNGLMQTGNQVLGYLSLIEAGICAAFLYKMYQPVADKNWDKLSSVYNGFRVSISKIVIKMLIAVGIVSVVYPFLLQKEGLNYFYMVSVFGLLGLKTVLPYKLMMVPKYMIVVQEQKYKAELISNLCRAFSYVLQIFLLLFTNWPLPILLMIGVVFSVLTGLLFQVEMKKMYGDKLSMKAEPDLSPKTMTKDVFVHNISKLVFSSTDNIIISTMGSLDAVTIYSNYNLISNQVLTLTQNIIDGASASMGIKIAGRDKNSYSVYREMLTGTYFIAGVISSVFVVMINDFVTLWIGEQYCVGLLDRVLFALIMYCGILLPCIQAARNACGLYKESKNFTVLQAVVNLVLTLILVPFLGITGALIGTALTRVLITVPCNYILVDRKVFPDEQSKWYELLGGGAISGVAIVIGNQLLSVLSINNFISDSIWLFIVETCVVVLVVIVIVFCFYFVADSSFRSLIRRIYGMIVRIANGERETR